MKEVSASLGPCLGLALGETAESSTLLRTAPGFVVGAGVGLVLTGVARCLIFKPAAWDSVVVKNDGFSLDIPPIALSVAGLLRVAHVGYSRGLQFDRKDAFEDTRRERLRFRR
jgi:hypothetical protein